jgi:hypothetical protein
MTAAKSRLRPNDSKSRLEVWWSDPAARSDIHLIVIGSQSTWSDAIDLRLRPVRGMGKIINNGIHDCWLDA